jgi:hypothetical protein
MFFIADKTAQFDLIDTAVPPCGTLTDYISRVERDIEQLIDSA